MAKITNKLEYVTIIEWFKYDKLTGKLYWKKSPAQNILEGCEAGTNHKNRNNFYKRIHFRYKFYYAHILIWILHNKSIPDGFEIDHIDHDGLNNRMANLRLVVNKENEKNKPMQLNNKSGITGVYYRTDTKKWRAYIRVNSKLINLGSYKDIKEAIETRQKAEKLYRFHNNHGKNDVSNI